MRIFKALNVFLLWTLCGAGETDIIQPKIFKTVGHGVTVDVTCYIYGEPRTRVWYKLSSSRRLQLLVSTDDLLNHIIYDKRYLIMSSSYTLRISDTKWEDAGMFYCRVLNLENVEFGQGTVLEIEGESKPIQSVLQGPDYIEAKPGDSVTLSCSFTSRHCRQEHTSVTWVRSGSSPSRIVSWNPEKSTVVCEAGDNPEEISCVHNLTLEDMSSAEDGTYVCVVIVCGDTRFGSGSRIELNGQCIESLEVFGPTVMTLCGLSVVLAVTVAVLLQEMDRVGRRSRQNTQAEDGVIYTGVNVVSCSTTFSVETSIEETTLYSIVKYSQAKICQD